MASPIDKLYGKSMDRKEFLVHAGAGLLTIAGLGAVTKTLLQSDKAPTHTATAPHTARPRAVSRTTPTGPSGYGNGAYGR
jgi:hypothetical protein